MEIQIEKHTHTKYNYTAAAVARIHFVQTNKYNIQIVWHHETPNKLKACACEFRRVDVAAAWSVL